MPGGPDLPTPSLTRTEHVPSELWEPFYTDQYAQEHVKPPVTRLLLSAELYCRAWRQALPQLETPPSPSALLALLARRGTVPALPDRPVQEADLRHQPILMVGPRPLPSAKPGPPDLAPFRGSAHHTWLLPKDTTLALEDLPTWPTRSSDLVWTSKPSSSRTPYLSSFPEIPPTNPGSDAQAPLTSRFFPCFWHTEGTLRHALG